VLFLGRYCFRSLVLCHHLPEVEARSLPLSALPPEASSLPANSQRQRITMMEATLTPTALLDSPLPDSSLPESPLLEKLRGALSQSHFLSPRQVRVETVGGNVRLEGTVGSFYQKQMAQELVRRVDGVETVENQLQVSWR